MYPLPEAPLIPRPATPLRIPSRRPADRVPGLVGVILAVTGAVGVLSALNVGVASRRWVGAVSPDVLFPVAPQMLLPVGVGFLVLAPAMWGRRRRAWFAACALFALLGVLAFAQGPSRLGLVLTWGTLALLLLARDRFIVRGDPVISRTPRAVHLLVVGAVVCALVELVLNVAQDDTSSWAGSARDVAGLLVAATAPLGSSELALVFGVATSVLGLTSIALLARAALAPAARPVDAVGDSGLDRAHAVVRMHGADSLSFFTLRSDVSHLWSPDGRAFAAVRREAGVMLISGDPVGPEDSLPALLEVIWRHADEEGLQVAALGADDAMCRVYRAMGMRRLYIGDEAIVHTDRFSLVGRPIRKVRQSVNRLEREGFTFSLTRLGELDPATLAALADVSKRWRQGTPERGFSMALDTLGGSHQRDTWIALARDGDGAPRGFLQFVPCGDRAASLSFMRRDPATPNGLSEYLVARALERFRDDGVARVSLNFAMFGVLFRSPRARWQRACAWVLKKLNRQFQMKSLHDFNEKFFPEWYPRYLVFEQPWSLPRVAIACLWAEGQVPRPPFLRRRATADEVSDGG